jgi:hypothetical protein
MQTNSKPQNDSEDGGRKKERKREIHQAKSTMYE